MKIKSGFILRSVCNSYVVVAVGAQAKEFRGMIKLNETGAFLWEQLQREKSEEQLLAALLEAYEVDETTAKNGISAFLESLNSANLIV